ncbi:MAG: serine/threonine protein kinase, partial [Candidatus Riflebacteria bacterium]|nr:serine/threonine protein kinase [Candidatus Riflebacteria bacterium]
MRIDLPRIPGYRILAQLGAGSSGTVYRALQSDLGRQVALKILAPGLFDAEETRARFLREARLQARLAHGNLVALFDAGIVGEQAYLATEYVDGGTLRRLLGRPAALPLQHALRLAQEIAAGLTHAHEAGIVHRDLKPENVLLTAGGTAKVADFGLARSMEGNQTLKTAADRIMGTPGYLAPEVLCGATATCAADLYALGVILFEMFAGRKPLVG